MTTVGIVLLAIALPTALMLTFLAVSQWGDTRRFQIAGVIVFAVVALWNLGSVIYRAVHGDFGLLFFIELALAVGFAFQAWWFWKTNLLPEE